MVKIKITKKESFNFDKHILKCKIVGDDGYYLFSLYNKFNVLLSDGMKGEGRPSLSKIKFNNKDGQDKHILKIHIVTGNVFLTDRIEKILKKAISEAEVE